MTLTHSLQDSGHDLVFLPRDLFWLVVCYLAPVDLVRCRRVSRAWNEAFSNPDVLVPILKTHFPRTQEVQDIQSSPSGAKNGSYRQVFDQVVARYHYLQQGRPRSVQKYRLCDDFGSSGELEFFQVQPWEWHASHIMADVDHLFAEAMWTHEDGLLVYPSADHQCLVLMDLSNDRQFMVPFIIHGKVVRRFRLQKRLLVVEWAEPKAFHWLNDSDGVHRHFASSFDVTRKADGGWSIAPRNEWKIMFLGHPLSERDRFYSSHSNTHYVIYIWQPNRSLYTADEDAPIESLIVWDISNPSLYRPSIDPTGSQTGPEVDQAPSIVARFGFQDLDFFSIRQRGFPNVQRLDVTDDGQAIEFTGNCTFPAEQSSFGYPQTVTTTLPIKGNGPHGRRPVDMLPAYRGDFTLQSLSEKNDFLLLNTWYGIIAKVRDDNAGVNFWVSFDPIDPAAESRTILLSIETRSTEVIHETMDFAGSGNICGCERYLVGENCNRELVIYRFDR